MPAHRNRGVFSPLAGRARATMLDVLLLLALLSGACAYMTVVVALVFTLQVLGTV